MPAPLSTAAPVTQEFNMDSPSSGGYRDPAAAFLDPVKPSQQQTTKTNLPFNFPIKPTATMDGPPLKGKASVTTTTTTTTTTQRAGWTEFTPQPPPPPQSSAANTTNSTNTNKSPSPDPTGSPININHVLKIHHNNNYNIVNNISIKVGGREDEESDEGSQPVGGRTSSNPQQDSQPLIETIQQPRGSPNSARQSQTPSSTTPLIPKPPESARPATSASASKSNSAATQPATTAGAVPPRPNTAAGTKPSSTTSSASTSKQSSSTPVPPSTNSTSIPPTIPTTDKATAVSHYAVGKTIGEGTFGKVKKGIHKLTGLPVAIKILEKERIVDLADVERVKREIHILTRVRHPNVIRLFEVIDSPRHIFLIMEHCSGGELFDYIVAQGRVKEEQACRFFHQILNGTDYFHNKNIIHRDLKPENLLFDSDSCIKIVDFGLGNVVKPGKLLKTACGSPCYAAPEMIAGKKYVGPGCDMWSLGVILFALLCGYLPFEDANTARLYEKIMGGEYDLPDFLSADGKDLIQRLLNTDPRKRYNAEQVRRHVWYARLHVPTDPAFGPGDLDAPVIPGPQASGKKVKKTISGQSVDDETEIDQEIIRHMVMLGYHPQQVTESITSNRHDHFAATYHLLLMKKQLANKQQQKNATTNSSSASNITRPQPPPVPRIPTGSAAQAGPMVPSAPVASVHHPQPPPTSKPTQAYAVRPQTQHSQHHAPSSASTTGPPSQPQVAFMSQTSPNSQQSSSQQPSTARVQSAGTVRPSIPGSQQSNYPATARPTTSYQSTKSSSDQPPQAQHHGAQAWGNDSSVPVTSSLVGSMGVSNGINGGAGVNAYMQHYQQQQQAALYAANAGANAQAYYRPPSSVGGSPNASSRGPQPPQAKSSPSAPNTARSATPSGTKVSSPYPHSRAPSSGGSARGGRGAKIQNRGLSATGPIPTVPQTLFVTNPLDSIASPLYPGSSPRSSSGSAGTVAITAAIGPATGRPMTSRITGSTGGVSHRLYFPPSEKAAHDMALAAAAAAAAAQHQAQVMNASSRPGTGVGSRPSSSMGMSIASRPGTSASSRAGSHAQRPPSGQRHQPRSGYGAANKTPREREREREREARERADKEMMADDVPLDELEWTTPVSPRNKSSTPATTTSSFNTQLSAMSFKPMRAILDELQRVLHGNGLTFTILPPTNASGATSSPIGKHGFVPGQNQTTAAAGLAPISISSLRPLPRPGSDDSTPSSSSQVLEVRSGTNRFQFHVAALSGASAGLAKQLAADLDADSPTSSATSGGGGYAVRVKRVLGDAQSFRDICAKLLPQLKL